MVRERAWSGCRGQLQRLADSALDVDSLRLEVMAQLRQAIGFDLWCCPLIDPDSLIPHRPVVSDALPSARARSRRRTSIRGRSGR
jgi:hypothetical protein